MRLCIFCGRVSTSHRATPLSALAVGGGACPPKAKSKIISNAKKQIICTTIVRIRLWWLIESMASISTALVEENSQLYDITPTNQLRATVPGFWGTFRKTQWSSRKFSLASGRAFPRLEILLPRLPVIFFPALGDSLVVVGRHADVGEMRGCAIAIFFKTDDEDGIGSSLLPSG